MSHDTSGVGRDGWRYFWLWVLGAAVGWFEASVVVYLRELYFPQGFRFPVVLAPPRIAMVELARELASIVLLAAAARLAGQHFLRRFGAFMLLFGVWDLVYYASLKLVLDWPASLRDWDVLFLIPVPWLGPVWAPCLISLLLVATGSYLYFTATRDRAYRLLDWTVEVVAGLLVVLSFTWNWRVILEHRVPEEFPAAVFWAGVLLGTGWFLSVEPRARRQRRRRSTSPDAAVDRAGPAGD